MNRKRKRVKILAVNILTMIFFIMLIMLIGIKSKDNLQNLLPQKTKNLKAGNTLTTMKIGDKVNYNHKLAADGDQTKLRTTLKDGNVKVPGTGHTESNNKIGDLHPDQNFNAENINVEWIVWDINSATGVVTLISKNTLPEINTSGAVGHIWWEHNAHQLASIFGHGIGADKKQISYKVGSGIAGAGDTATWKTGQSNEGQEGIPLSGAWALTLDEVEEKLRIPANKAGKDYDWEIEYGNTVNNMDISIPLRDIGQPDSSWQNKSIGLGIRKSYGKVIQQDYAYQNKNTLFKGNPYKDIIFPVSGDYGLATNGVYVESEFANFGRGYVSSTDLSGAYWHLFDGFNKKEAYFHSRSIGERVLVKLEPSLNFAKSSGSESAWNIIKNTKIDKELKLSTLNLSSNTKIGVSIESDGLGDKLNNIALNLKGEESETQLKYNTIVPIYLGRWNDETLCTNRYKLKLTGIPEGYTYKIYGNEEKPEGKKDELDLDEKLEYRVVIYKEGGEIPGAPNGMKVGDIVYYNHKTAEDNDNSKLTTTLKAGSVKEPGTGHTESEYKITGLQPDQTYNAENIDVEWIVWDIDKTDGSVTLISKNTLPTIKTGGAVGHIWWEHNAHQLASIFGHGVGADKKQTSYKVGSGIPGAGDTATWKTGQSNEGQAGIPLSGAWSLTLPEVEEKLKVPADKANREQSSGIEYGDGNSISIPIPLRDVGQAESSWTNKENGQGIKKLYENLINEEYTYNKTNALFNNNPYRDIIFPKSGSYALATNTLSVYANSVYFYRGRLYSSILYGTGWRLANGDTIGSFNQYSDSHPSRALVKLQASNIYKKANNVAGIPAWDVAPKKQKKELILNIVSGSIADGGNPTLKRTDKLSGDDVFTAKNTTQDINEYKTFIDKYVGNTRQGEGSSAVFTRLNEDKYTLDIPNLQLGYGYRILGNPDGDKVLDVNKSLNYDIEIYDKYNLSLKEIKLRKGSDASSLNLANAVINLPEGAKVELKPDSSVNTDVIGVQKLPVVVTIDGVKYDTEISVNVLSNTKLSLKYINSILGNKVYTDKESGIKLSTLPDEQSNYTALNLNEERYEVVLNTYGEYELKFLEDGEYKENTNGFINLGPISIVYEGDPNGDEYAVLKKNNVEVPGSKVYLYKTGDVQNDGDTLNMNVPLIEKVVLPFTGTSLKRMIVAVSGILLVVIIVGKRDSIDKV